MKFLFIVLLLCSCSTSLKSPVTQIEYTGTINKDGITINALPPFWKLAESIYSWVTGSENNQNTKPPKEQ